MYQNTDVTSFKREIKPLELLGYIIKKWYILFTIVIVAVAMSIIYFKFLVTPVYTSTARMYVVNKNSSDITSSDLSVSLYLSKDYAEIILDTPILEAVREDINDAYTVSEIRDFTTVDIPENTRILEIQTTTPNAKLSKKIVDSICEISQEELVEIMGLDRIKIIKEGTISNTPSNSNVVKPIIRVSLISLLLALCAIYIMYILDNKVTTQEDVEKYLQLNILSTIPYNPNIQNKNKTEGLLNGKSKRTNR